TGAGSNPDVSGFTVTGGSYGLEMRSGAGGIYTGNIFTGASRSGIFLDVSGSVKVSRNTIINNGQGSLGGGINLSAAAAGTSVVISHNLIRGNRGTTGGGVYVASSIPGTIQNNLILDNHATSTGGGVSIKAGSSALLYNNTIAMNKSNVTTSGGGVHSAGTSILKRNIVFGNQAGASALQPDDFVDVGTSTLSYNLIGVDPVFSRGWYLETGSPAIDGDPTMEAVDLHYLAEIGTWGTANGVTEVSGQADAGNADLGYHHGSGPKTVSEANSLITAEATTIGAGGTTLIVVTPVDDQGIKFGPGQNVKVNNLAGPNDGESISGGKDLGDGTYELEFTAGKLVGPATITVEINGVALPGKPIVINWP
ncbi:MAG: right-handed parallel beta-helix repeat-containing protein, partial [Nitrospinota bacterium]